MATLSSLGIFLALSIACVYACSPEGYIFRTPVQRVHDADAVVYGRVLRTYPDPSVPDDVYTAEMEVYCVIKGTVEQHVLNVSHAGVVGGWCFSTTLEQGKDYIITLSYYEQDESYRPDEGTYEPEQLAEIAKACGLMPRYPEGVTSSSNPDKQCPVPADAASCTQYTEPTPYPSPTLPPAPQIPSKQPKEGRADTGEESANTVTDGDSGAQRLASSLLIVTLVALVMS